MTHVVARVGVRVVSAPIVVAPVAASAVRAGYRPASTPFPWASLGRAAAGAAQTLGLAALFWLLVALPGVLSARDSTLGHGARPGAAVVVRR